MVGTGTVARSLHLYMSHETAAVIAFLHSCRNDNSRQTKYFDQSKALIDDSYSSTPGPVPRDGTKEKEGKRRSGAMSRDFVSGVAVGAAGTLLALSALTRKLTRRRGLERVAKVNCGTREVTCPNNHPLSLFATPLDTFMCDGCAKHIAKGTTMQGCRKCDYDLCISCCEKKERGVDLDDDASSVGSESEESFADRFAILQDLKMVLVVKNSAAILKWKIHFGLPLHEINRLFGVLRIVITRTRILVMMLVLLEL